VDALNRRHLTAISLLLTIPFIALTTHYLLLRNPNFYATAVTTEGQIGVYWDKTCTHKVTSITWGTLMPGNTKEIIVYARNEGNEISHLKLSSTGWIPTNAPNYLTFTWSSEKTRIAIGETVKVKQSLRVSPNIKGISTFNFNIVFTGTTLPPWDINQDGKVDILDLTIVMLAYGSAPGSANWDPRADLNGNGIVDITDAATVTVHYGEQYA
jgi:hypothetical protein